MLIVSKLHYDKYSKLFDSADTLCENTNKFQCNFKVYWTIQKADFVNREVLRFDQLFPWNFDIFFVTTLLTAEQQCKFLEKKYFFYPNVYNILFIPSWYNSEKIMILYVIVRRRIAVHFSLGTVRCKTKLDL